MGKTMSSSNLIFIIIVFLIVEISTIFCQSKNNNVTFDCVPNEKTALLRFKSSFSDDPSNYNMLSSWKSNTGCCSWAGVECDNATGQVVGLDMSGVDLGGTKDVVYKVLNMLPSLVDLGLSNCGLGDTNLPLANCVNRSTLPFNNIQYLDMSSNSFGENSSFCFLQNMTSLSYLNLSSNSIHQNVDWINDNLWDKCHLKSLDLGYNRFYGDISGIFKNLSDGCWGRNLENLFFKMNEFNGHIPSSLGNLRALRLLSLSHNPLGGEIPISLGQLSNLEGIGIIDNKLSGPIPSSLGNLRALTELWLSDNQLCGEIPFSLGQLSNLEWMDISDNKLSGYIPFSLGNMRALRVLGLSSNKLGGEIPFSLGQLSNLVLMDISDNKLSGPIPFSLGNMRALRSLDLSSNQLGGEIPISLGQLSNLEAIYMHNNSLEGTLLEAHFNNLSRLEALHIYDNKMVKLKVGDDWVPPFHQLQFLYMRSVEIETQFPQWIQTLKSLMELDLRNCSIRGTLPPWLGSLMNLTRLNLNKNHIEGTLPPWLGSLNNLSVLDLSNNRFEGPIPDLPSKMEFLDLSDNMITNHLPSNIAHMMPFLRELYLARNLIDGSIPESLCQMKDLYYLDLSRNHLSGHLPDCNWGNLSDLRVAILSSNHLYGTIPDSIGGGDYCSLRLFQLDNNSFTGLIPITLMNCKSLIVLDVGDNKLSGGNLPEWIGIYLMDLAVLRIRNNKFDGDIPSSYCRLYRLQVMDLAHNQLTGYIPKCLDNLWGMTINFGGFPPVSDGWSSDVMESTSSDSLELRCNRLFGDIHSHLMNFNVTISCINC